MAWGFIVTTCSAGRSPPKGYFARRRAEALLRAISCRSPKFNGDGIRASGDPIDKVCNPNLVGLDRIAC
jgi:hypothetical protein